MAAIRAAEGKSEYMSMFDVSRVSREVGGKEISFETGKLARQASGAVVVRSGDTMVLSHRDDGQPARRRLPAADGRRRGEALRGRQDPRVLLPPRGARRGEGDADGADDRPAAAAAVPEGLALRDAARLPAALGRLRPPLRHPGDERRLRRAWRSRRSRWRRTSASVRIGKLDGDFVDQPRGGDLRGPRDGPDRLRLRGRDPDGRVRRQRRHRGRGARRARHRPRRDQEDLSRAMEELRDKAGKEKLEVEAPEGRPGAWSRRFAPRYGAKLDEATQIHEKLARQDAVEGGRGAGRSPQYAAGAGTARTPTRRSRAEVSRAFDRLEKEIIRRRIAIDKKRPDGRAAGRDPADRVRGRHLAARARLGAVHPRGDADPVQRRARDEPHGHEGRQPQPPGVEDLLAPLQLPAVLGRGGGLHARPEAPRHRPRRARRARSGAHDPEPGGLPVRDPGGLGDARVERVLVDGLGLRLLDGPDGRRRAGVEPGRRASPWG